MKVSQIIEERLQGKEWNRQFKAKAPSDLLSPPTIHSQTYYI